jgi:pimeloyl-ACP methyl ester carboxylesterase
MNAGRREIAPFSMSSRQNQPRFSILPLIGEFAYHLGSQAHAALRPKFDAKIKETREKLKILRLLHSGAAKALKMQGFRWELRRSGELKLGLWRKRFNKTKKASPKRLVLIPGFGDTPLSWLGVLALLWPVLKGNYDEVVIVDFPGFSGFLGGEKGFHSMDLLRDAINDTLDTLSPHTILGHSLGGYLAAQYAVACGKSERPKTVVDPTAVPSQVKRSKKEASLAQVILVDPSGVFEDDSVREKWMEHFRIAVKEGLHILKPMIFTREPALFKIFEKEVSEFILHDDIAQFIGSVNSTHALGQGLDQVKAKVWLVWGEKDGLIPADNAKLWLKHFSQAVSQAEGQAQEEFKGEFKEELQEEVVGNPAPAAPAAEEANLSGSAAQASMGVDAKAIVLKGLGHSPHIEGPAVTAAVLGQILAGREPHRMGSRWWSKLEA